MSTTLAQLRTQTRSRADMTNSEFVSDSELNQFISDSYAELYDLLVSKFEDYYLSQTDFTISSGNTYDLPADFYKIKGVDRVSGSSYFALEPFQFAQRNREGALGLIRYSRDSDIKYRVLGNQLHFTPIDQATGDYRLWYVPRYTALTSDSSTVDGVNGWEVYIVTDAAIKCAQKEESDVGVLMAQKQALIQRIETMAQSRDVGTSDQITDVRGGNRFGIWPLGYY